MDFGTLGLLYAAGRPVYAAGKIKKARDWGER